MKPRFTGLWRHSDFMKLWIGQTISAFGSHITRDGLALVAIMILGASPAELGLLAAISALPTLVLNLPAGAWVDRLRRRPMMIAMDVGRMALLLTIPAATLSGHLTLALVYVVAAAHGVLSLIFDLAYHSVLPTLVRPDQILEGNSKLATTDSLSEIGGSAMAGILVQLITAPLAIFFDAVSFVFSAVSVAMIRTPEPIPEPPDEGRTVWRDIVDGLQVITRNPVLRTIAVQLGLHSFFGNFYAALYSLYAIRDLGLTPGALGVVIGAGGIGALVGALLAQWAPRRFGLGQMLTGSLLAGALISLLIPLAGGPPLLAAAILIAGQVCGDAFATLYQVNEMSLRQVIVPNRLLGRANASMGFLAQATGPAGALVAGGLAGLLGTRLTLLAASMGLILTALWVLTSPLRGLVAHPEAAGD